MKKINWDKPIVHYQGVPVSYVGRQERRDGKPITDGFAHLILSGKDGRSNYLDDYGRAHGDKQNKRLVFNDAPDEDHANQPDHEALDDLREEMRELKRHVHGWSQAAGSLNQKLTAQLEELKKAGAEQQQAVLDICAMTLEEMKKLVTSARPAEPEPAEAPAAQAEPAARGNVIRFPVDQKKVDLEQVEKLDSAELRCSVAAVMSHDAVSKVVIGTYDRRGTHTVQGDLRLVRETPHGLLFKGTDTIKTREVFVFLRNLHRRQEVVEFARSMCEDLKQGAVVGAKR